MVCGVIALLGIISTHTRGYGGIPEEITLAEIFFVVAFLGVPLLYLATFYLRVKIILKYDRLIIGRFFRTIEIPYSSIKSVEEVIDRSVYVANFSPSASSPKQVWIRYSDFNGREEIANICPAKKQEFLAELRLRLPDQSVYNPGEKKADVKFQSFKSLSPAKRKGYFVYIAVVIGIFVVIRLLRM